MPCVVVDAHAVKPNHLPLKIKTINNKPLFQNETRDIVEQSIEYIESYGFTEADFYEELDIGYDPALVMELAMVLQIINEEQVINYTSMNLFPFINKTYAQERWVSAAIMVYDYASCMNWVYSDIYMENVKYRYI